MLAKLVNKIPRDWLVFMYKHTPFTRLKNALVYQAQHKFLVAVLGIFTNNAGEVLLLKHVYRKQPWGIPGGWMELEQPGTALRREVQEETGLEVEITSLVQAQFGQMPNRVDLIFTGRVIPGTFRPSAEISDICYCRVGEWPEGLPAHQKKLIQKLVK
ncbi:NUDIX hydrolase [Paenibacillus sp. CMAA1739]|uniref:NUDIX hydrolase n=1 Tax=Paenibacillus ottowii TaxID=2315729 RepID=UPI002732247A|nr:MULTISPECIES: NUDIX hydrolase [Paenibacillus]MDP1511129.1 NUDIX hydrolase [Paenibacillus ottowii]MEC4566373.1 NUDIX hydrolase [Paenibacillus sp. CMAA1739]